MPGRASNQAGQNCYGDPLDLVIAPAQGWVVYEDFFIYDPNYTLEGRIPQNFTSYANELLPFINNVSLPVYKYTHFKFKDVKRIVGSSEQDVPLVVEPQGDFSQFPYYAKVNSKDSIGYIMQMSTCPGTDGSFNITGWVYPEHLHFAPYLQQSTKANIKNPLNYFSEKDPGPSTGNDPQARHPKFENLDAFKFVAAKGLTHFTSIEKAYDSFGQAIKKSFIFVPNDQSPDAGADIRFVQQGANYIYRLKGTVDIIVKAYDNMSGQDENGKSFPSGVYKISYKIMYGTGHKNHTKGEVAQSGSLVLDELKGDGDDDAFKALYYVAPESYSAMSEYTSNPGIRFYNITSAKINATQPTDIKTLDGTPTLITEWLPDATGTYTSTFGKGATWNTTARLNTPSKPRVFNDGEYDVEVTLEDLAGNKTPPEKQTVQVAATYDDVVLTNDNSTCDGWVKVGDYLTVTAKGGISGGAGYALLYDAANKTDAGKLTVGISNPISLNDLGNGDYTQTLTFSPGTDTLGKLPTEIIAAASDNNSFENRSFSNTLNVVSQTEDVSNLQASPHEFDPNSTTAGVSTTTQITGDILGFTSCDTGVNWEVRIYAPGGTTPVKTFNGTGIKIDTGAWDGAGLTDGLYAIKVAVNGTELSSLASVRIGLGYVVDGQGAEATPEGLLTQKSSIPFGGSSLKNFPDTYVGGIARLSPSGREYPITATEFAWTDPAGWSSTVVYPFKFYDKNGHDVGWHYLQVWPDTTPPTISDFAVTADPTTCTETVGTFSFDAQIQMYFCFTTSELNEFITVEVYDASGTTRLRALKNTAVNVGGFEGFREDPKKDKLFTWIGWDGQKEDGTFVTPGIYTVKIKVQDVAGNYTKIKTQVNVDFAPVQLTGVYASPNKFSPSLTLGKIYYTLSRNAIVTLNILNASGDVVDTLIYQNILDPGSHVEYWDGRNSNGQFVPDGTYTYNIEATPPQGGTVVSASDTVETDNTPPTVTVSASNLYISPNGDGVKDSTDITYSVNEATSSLSVKLYDSQGNFIKPLGSTWDGTNSQGNKVDDGQYFIIITATDLLGNIGVASGKIIVDTNQAIQGEFGGLVVDKKYPVTSGSGPLDNVLPVWSRDGRKIAYVRQSRLGGDELRVLDLGSSADYYLDSGFYSNSPLGDIISPSRTLHGFGWSADSTKVIYCNYPVISAAAYDGSSKTNIFYGVDAGVYCSNDLDVSQDGKIAFNSFGGLLSVDTNGNNLQWLTPNNYPLVNFGPTWSPDSQKIAYTSRDYSLGSGVVTINADGSGKTIVSSGNSSGYPRWSPDGTQLVFSKIDYDPTFTGDWQDIFIANADGSNKSRVTSSFPSWAGYPWWSPDGNFILFWLDGHITLINTEGKYQRMVDTGSGAVFSPDGKKIAYSANTNGNWDIWVATLKPGKPPVVLTTDITSPLSGDAITTGGVDIQGTATDEYFGKYVMEYQHVGEGTWHGIATGKTAVVNGLLGLFEVSELSNGTYTLRLTATDLAGNQRQDSVTVTVQNPSPLLLTNVAPTESTISPASSSGTQASAAIRYTLQYRSYVTLKVLDVARNAVRTFFTNVLQESGNYAYSWDGRGDASWIPIYSVYSSDPNTQPVPDGSYTFRVSAMQEGTTNTQVRETRILVDNTPPTVRVLQPPTNSYIGNTVIFKGSATDINFDAYTVGFGAGGSPSSFTPLQTSSSPIEDGTLAAWDTSRLSDGTYTVKIAASDTAGNVSEQTFTLLRDTVPPAMTSVTVLPTPFSPNNDGNKDTALLSFYLSEDAYVTVGVYGSAGNFIRSLIAANVVSGTQNIVWDGKDDFGNVVFDGTYTFRIDAQDAAGNIGTASASVVVDTTKPVASVVQVNPTAFSPNNDGIVDTVAFSYTLSEGGYVTANVLNSANNVVYRFFITPKLQPPQMQTVTWDGTGNTGEGLYTFQMSVEDLAGNLSDAATGQVLLDFGPPEIKNVSDSPDPFSPNNATSVGVKDTTLITADIVETGNATWEITIKNAGNTPLRTFTGTTKQIQETWDGKDSAGNFVSDGTYTYAISATDALGNRAEEKTGSVSVDNTNPQTTLSSGTPKFEANGKTYITSATPLSLSATDPQVNGFAAGLSYTQYRVDSGTFVAYTGSAFLLQEGIHTVEYQSLDNVGNTESVKSGIFYVDNTLPVTTLSTGEPKYQTADKVYVTPNTPITLTANDPVTVSVSSGVSKIEYKIDSANYAPYTSAITLSEGVHTASYRSVDNVGNTEQERTHSFYVDSTPPVTTLTPSAPLFNNLYAPLSTTYSLSAVDPVSGNVSSGVMKIIYKVDGGAETQYTTAISLTEGEHTITYNAKDNVLNTETQKSFTVRVDNTPPVTQFVPSAPLFANKYAPLSTTYLFTAADPVSNGVASGVAKIQYTLDGGVITTVMLQ